MTIFIYRTFDELNKVIGDIGYNLLKDWGYSNKRMVLIEDCFGYRYEVFLSNLLAGHRPKLTCPHKNYSLYNISLWLINNNKTFKLINNNEYFGVSFPLEFCCLICNEIFYSSWGNIKCNNKGCSVCLNCKAGKKTSLGIFKAGIGKRMV